MKSINKWLSRDSFNQNVLKLATGTTLVQVVSIGMAPILSRLFTPSDYGVVAIYLAITTSISVISTGQYEVSIILPDEDEEAANIAVLALCLAFLVSLMSLLFFVFFRNEIARFVGDENILNWIYFAPITIFQSGLNQTLNCWSNRKKYYRRIAEMSILQSIVNAGFNLYSGLNGFGAGGLILGGIFSQLVGASFLGFYVAKKSLFLGKSLTIKEIFRCALKYRDFPKFNAPQVFFDTFRTNGIYFAITNFYSVESLGHYSLAQRVIQLPISLVSNPVSQVFYRELAETHNGGGDLWMKCKELIKKLILVLMPLVLIIAIFSPFAFSFAFGSNWVQAGVYARILLPWIVMSFVASPLSMVPIVLRRQKQFFFIGLLVSILIPGTALTMASLNVSFGIMLLGISMVASMSLASVILWTRKISLNS